MIHRHDKNKNETLHEYCRAERFVIPSLASSAHRMSPSELDVRFFYFFIFFFCSPLWHAVDNRSPLFSSGPGQIQDHHHLLISCSYLKLCLSEIGTRWPQSELSGDLPFRLIWGCFRMSRCVLFWHPSTFAARFCVCMCVCTKRVPSDLMPF